jgi:hypothetical protein
MRRPSPATAIALVALFLSLSGTAYAATGGNFLLGKANSANAVSSLTNKNGTALSLSSNAASPPLTVSNSVQVPNLNASELDGATSSSFLAAGGTAANSNELGGTPASGYIHGGGSTAGSRLSLTGSGSAYLLISPGGDLAGYCDDGGKGSGASLAILPFNGTSPSAFWWNKDGVGSAVPLNTVTYVTPGLGSTSPYVVTIQIDNATSMATFVATERYDAGTDTCHYTGVVVTTNG